MAINPILGRDVYLALAAVGWADGKLTTEAADAIVRTALEEGLDLDVIGEIEAATKTPTDVGVVDRMNMSKSDRLYVYAVASWIAQLDGAMSDKELDALKKLGTALGVPETPRKHADAIMREIAEHDDRPARFDLRTLRRTLDECLEEAAAMRKAKKPDDPDASGERSALKAIVGGASDAKDEKGDAPVESSRRPRPDSMPAQSEDQAQTVAERPRVDIRYVICHKPGARWKSGVDFREQEGIGAHLEHYRRLLEEQKLELGGAFLDGTGAMMVPVAGMMERDVQAFAEADPAVKEGLLVFEIKRWYVSLRKV